MICGPRFGSTGGCGSAFPSCSDAGFFELGHRMGAGRDHRGRDPRVDLQHRRSQRSASNRMARPWVFLLHHHADRDSGSPLQAHDEFSLSPEVRVLVRARDLSEGTRLSVLVKSSSTPTTLTARLRHPWSCRLRPARPVVASAALGKLSPSRDRRS